MSYLERLQRSMSEEEYADFCQEWLGETDGEELLENLNSAVGLLEEAMNMHENNRPDLALKPLIRAVLVLREYIPRNEDLE